MVFETTVKVRFGDVDKAGIAYYPRVLGWCHVAFEEFFERAVGAEYSKVIDERRLGFPTVKLETDFENPFEYGATAKVEVRVAKMGRTSVTWDYRFFSQDGRRLAHSINVTACVDMDSFRPVPLPDDLRAVFAKHD